MLRGEGEQGERIVLLLPRVAFTLAVAICDTRDENSFEHRPSRPAGKGNECWEIPKRLRSRGGPWGNRRRGAGAGKTGLFSPCSAQRSSACAPPALTGRSCATFSPAP